MVSFDELYRLGFIFLRRVDLSWDMYDEKMLVMWRVRVRILGWIREDKVLEVGLRKSKKVRVVVRVCE